MHGQGRNGGGPFFLCGSDDEFHRFFVIDGIDQNPKNVVFSEIKHLSPSVEIWGALPHCGLGQTAYLSLACVLRRPGLSPWIAYVWLMLQCAVPVRRRKAVVHNFVRQRSIAQRSGVQPLALLGVDWDWRRHC